MKYTNSIRIRWIQAITLHQRKYICIKKALNYMEIETIKEGDDQNAGIRVND